MSLLVVFLLVPASATATDYRQFMAQAFLPSSSLANGQSVLQSTFLLDARQGSELSERANAMRSGGFETSTGSSINFDQWYSTKWVDARFTWITQVDRHLGLIWGFSTGERGEKYRIEPSMKVGFAVQRQLDKSWNFSLTATTIFGGRLREKSCIADYGDIGGVQEVNCRLAASILAPEDTLQYLINEKPFEHHFFMARFNYAF